MAKREKKEKVRINLDVSKELAVKIKDKREQGKALKEEDDGTAES